MKVLGVVFESNVMKYVLVEIKESTSRIIRYNKQVLSDTRSKDAVKVFSRAVESILNGTEVGLIAIKEKPENAASKYRAGAASLKMEVLLLLAANSEVKFVSGVKINGCELLVEHLPKSHIDAYKAAIVASRE